MIIGRKLKVKKSLIRGAVLIIFFLILKIFNITYWSYGYGLLYILFYLILSISIENINIPFDEIE